MGQLLMTLWILASVALTSVLAQGNETYTLDNGLKVTLIDTPGAQRSALVVLYDIGGDHDPPGQSGLTHLLEHLYVTAAAGDCPARDVQTFISAYPDGWNAQTGAQYTIIATMFPNDRLEDELRDAADRMHDLHIEQSDLDRERPRVIEEVGNMFNGHPQLSSFNNGFELVRPSRHGGRRAGQPEQLRTMTLVDLQMFYAKHYRPNNARLVIAAPDVDRVRPMVDALFSKIESGTDIEPVPGQRKPVDHTDQIIDVHTNGAPGTIPPTAAVALRSPTVTENIYPAFLLVIGRLYQSSGAMTNQPKAMLQYQMLDAPEVLTIAITAGDGKTLKEARTQVDAIVHDALNDPVTQQDAAWVEINLGMMLGMIEINPMVKAQNPYFAAFVTGRHAQMGLDGETLRQQLRRVDNQQLAALRNWLKANAAQARFNVVPEPKTQQQH